MSAGAAAPTVAVAQNMAPTQPSAPASVSRVKLVLIRPDGTEGGTASLNDGVNSVGRSSGPLFANDTYLSPKHCTITITGGGSSITVRDEASLNGVYLRVERNVATELSDGDMFRIGQEILRFEAYGPQRPEADGTERQGAQIEGLVGRICLIIGRDTVGNAFPIPVTGLNLGRERGDILFPEDGYVSGLHCQLVSENGRLTLTDLGSSNGTYIRLRAERRLNNGDLLLIGQQLFRITL